MNIPFDQLPERTYELPAPSVVIRVGNSADVGLRTLEWLLRHRRKAELVNAQAGHFEAPGRLWSPNNLLTEYAAEREPAQAVDLGCGTGRDTVFLAALGWKVKAIDILPDAIAKGRLLSSRYPLSEGRIEWTSEPADSFEFADDLDLVTSFMFLDREALSNAVRALRIGGLLLLQTYTPEHRERFGKPRDKRLTMSAAEFALSFPNFRLLLCREESCGDRHLLQVAAEKLG